MRNATSHTLNLNRTAMSNKNIANSSRVRNTIGLWCLLIAVSFSAAFTSRAQDNNIGPFVSTVGTTWRDANNQDWAYLFWIGNEISLIGGRTYAIYGKSGESSSASPYARVGIVSLQTDARVIQPMLARGANIGDNTNNLHVDIDALFGKFVAPTLPLAEKVSAVLRGAMADEGQLGRLLILARTHPSVAMAIGIGHAEPIGPGKTTFEVREFDRGTQKDIAVVGRVTVEAGVPTVMPPPGAPVQVPSPNARGDMNIALRWATPDALRRLSLLQHGFNVWRVMKHYAELQNWHVTPPTPAQLINAYNNTGAVWRLNRLPILPSKQFTPADVANFIANSNTIFAIDDNDVGRPNAPTPPPGWTNGARFYYFISARDILGRDGSVSPGTQVMVCDQLPPNALLKIKVENDYTYQGGTPQHHLRVVWDQADNSPTNDEKIVRYWIYRWTNANEVLHKQLNISNNLIAKVNHLPLAAKNSYLDNGPASPTPANAGRTYWYTVRAEDMGACGANLSPHSAPVPGTLRDRVGPPAPTGWITNVCMTPVTAVTTNGITAGQPQDGKFDVRVNGTRLTTRIAWMEFTLEVRNNFTNLVFSNVSARIYFPANASNITWNATVPGVHETHDIRIIARSGSTDGDLSNIAFSPFVDLNKLGANDDKRFNFIALTSLFPDRRRDCPDRHSPANPDGTINPVDIGVIPAAGTRELRFYRRVDDGPLTLICQFKVTNIFQFFNCSDDSFPAPGSVICWYVQAYDEHGNPSPLVKLGCSTILSLGGPPKPMLAPIQPTGDEDSPGMTLRWFCAPAGVKRFEVYIGGIPEQLPAEPSPLGLLVSPAGEPLQQHMVPKTIKLFDVDTTLQLVSFRKFITPVIGHGSSFGNGAEFTVPVSIKTGVRYYAFVKAVGLDDAPGESSNVESFFWKPPPTNAVPTVPWPARPLPNVGNSFNFAFIAQYQTNVQTGFTGATVLVGLDLTPQYLNAPSARPQRLNNVTNNYEPMSALAMNTNGSSIFPLVLYRYQVTNGVFPAVSGDIVQCSPMMEEIAYQRTVTNGLDLIIRDPFINYSKFSVILSDREIGYLFTHLIDTTPVMRGARYRYLLARFAPNGEIAEVIPTNEIEIP